MIDRGLSLRADLNERTLRPEQLDLLGLSRRNTRFRRAQHDVEDGLQLVVNLLGAVREEEVEVRRRDLRLHVALLLVEVRSRHRGVSPRRVRARAALSAQWEALAELDHHRDRGEIGRRIPELDHQHRVVQRACRPDGAMRSAHARRRGLQLRILLSRLAEEIRQAKRGWRSERHGQQHCDHYEPPAGAQRFG